MVKVWPCGWLVQNRGKRALGPQSSASGALLTIAQGFTKVPYVSGGIQGLANAVGLRSETSVDKLASAADEDAAESEAAQEEEEQEVVDAPADSKVRRGAGVPDTVASGFLLTAPCCCVWGAYAHATAIVFAPLGPRWVWHQHRRPACARAGLHLPAGG